jgi:serine/threonine protein kinase
MNFYPPGTRIGQYEIASHPMIGGMGVVYFALDHGNDGRPVALKTFKPEFLSDRDARGRILREGTTWVELDSHPNIVRCYKVEYYDPTTFLVLELIAKEQYMPDASLRPWLSPGYPLPLEQALLFALQIARGMQHATEKIPDFVHRDLKPENILVGTDRLFRTNINRVRVTDFGLAKAMVGRGTPVIVGDIDDLKPNKVQFTRGVGTPLYMAPEQWKGEPVGIYTDVYALGCILYEMLTGQPTARGNSISELRSTHCAGKLNHLPADEKFPTALRDLLRRSLALQSAERCQSWNDITVALERAYESHSLEIAPDEVPLEAESLDRRKETVSSYNAMAVAYKDIGNAQKAVRYSERALALARGLGDQRGESTALSNLGIAYDDLGNARRAVEFHQKALEIEREIGDRHGEAAVLGNLGTAYVRLGDERRSISYYEQQIEITREIGDWRGMGNALGGLGSAYHYLGEIGRAIESYERAFEIHHKIGYRRGQGIALGNLGMVYAQNGDPKRAIGYYEQALEIDREIADRRSEGTDLNHLGIAYADLGDERRAIECYEQSLTIKREIGARREESSTLGNLGGAYRRMGDVQRALEYYEHSLEIVREIGDRHGEGLVLGNLGNAYWDLGNVRKALEFYEKALSIRREIGATDLVASVTLNMARLYKQQGDHTRALALAEEAASTWLQNGNPRARQARQLITELQGGNPETQARAAFDAFQRADTLQSMQTVVSQHPILNDDQFLQRIEEIIQKQASPESRSMFQKRLAWLRQIVGK